MQFLPTLCLILISSLCAAQETVWKQEMKVKTGIIDYNLVRNGDNTYFIERRELPTAQPNSGGIRRSYINVSKLDQAFKEVWSREYFLALAEYDIITVVPAHGSLVIFLGRYNKKIKSYTIDIAPIDDKKGDIPKESQFTRVATYPRGERKEDFFTASVTAVQKGFLLVSDISGKKNVSHAVTMLSPELKTISNTIITYPSDPFLYTVEEVRISHGKLVVLGKIFQESSNPEGKKIRRLQRQVLSIYNVTGSYEGEIALGTSQITAARMAEVGDSLFFAGLYNTYTMRELPDGIITGMIDPVGKLLNVVNDKKIGMGMFATSYRGDTDTSEIYKRLPLLSFRNKRRYADSNSWIEMRAIDINPADKSVMIAAEIIQLDEYDEYVYGNAMVGGVLGAALPSGEIIKVYEYKTRDLVLFNADKKGTVNWINIVPKNQQETFAYFKPVNGHFSSFRSAYVDGKYIIIYNDNTLNSGPVDYREQVNAVWDFKRTASLFRLAVDPASGAIVKSEVTGTANEEAILMPLKSVRSTDALIIPARTTRPFAKDLFKIAVVE